VSANIPGVGVVMIVLILMNLHQHTKKNYAEDQHWLTKKKK
jgi:hypothetical protein